MRTTKQELLDRYSKCDPKAFIRLYGFDQRPDGFTNPEDSPGLYRSNTYELIYGSDVQIFIDPLKDRKTILRILHELVSWVERDESALSWDIKDENQIWLNESRDIALYRGRTYPIDSAADLEVLRRLQRENANEGKDVPF